MIETYSAIIQTVLAVFAFIISVFEICNYMKERKIVKEKEIIEKKLVDEISNIELEEQFKIVESSKTEVSDKTEKQLEDFIVSVEEVIKRLTPIYKQLLKDESCFSLSYGFDRYIISFRKICIEGNIILDELRKQMNLYSKVNAKVNMFSKDNEDNEIFIKNINMMLAANENGMSDEEIQKRTRMMQTNDNSYESTMGYYYHYKKIFKCIKRIKEIYMDVSPLLQELKFKYEKN